MLDWIKSSRRVIAVLLVVGLAACETVQPPQPAMESFMVFFGFDSADVDATAQEIIGRAVAKTTEFKPSRIQVSGYADVTGAARYNRALAERRARAVAGRLIDGGVPVALINMTAVGEESLLRDRTGERRVEILLLKD